MSGTKGGTELTPGMLPALEEFVGQSRLQQWVFVKWNLRRGKDGAVGAKEVNEREPHRFHLETVTLCNSLYFAEPSLPRLWNNN